MSHLLNATKFESVSLWVVLGIAVLGLLYALLLRRQVLRYETGTAEMKLVWDAIREGAEMSNAEHRMPDVGMKRQETAPMCGRGVSAPRGCSQHTTLQ